MAEESLHDDLREIRGMVTELVAAHARGEQKIDSLNERLFNHGAGAIPVLYNKCNACSTDLVNLRSDFANNLSAVKADVASVKTDRRVDKAYVMGASAVLSLSVKWVLSHVGWHF